MNSTEFRVSKTGALLALAYPLLFITLYFLLVAHLRLGQGRWPNHISDNPKTMLFHCHEVAVGLLFLGGMVLVPLGAGLCVACAFDPTMRRRAAYLGLFAISGLAAYGLMHLAPSSFMLWWWD